MLVRMQACFKSLNINVQVYVCGRSRDEREEVEVVGWWWNVSETEVKDRDNLCVFICYFKCSFFEPMCQRALFIFISLYNYEQ